MPHDDLLKKPIKPKEKKTSDYVQLNDGQIVKRGARAEKKGLPRVANPYTRAPGQLWVYGWNKQHGECKGCKQCHYRGTPKMPKSYLIFMRSRTEFDRWP